MAKEKEEFDEFLKRFDDLAKEFFDAAGTDEKRRELVAVMRVAYLDLGRNARRSTGLGCPPQWFECDDGSCVRSQNECPGSGRE